MLCQQGGTGLVSAEISAATSAKLFRNLLPLVTYVETKLQALGCNNQRKVRFTVHPGLLIFLNLLKLFVRCV